MERNRVHEPLVLCLEKLFDPNGLNYNKQNTALLCQGSQLSKKANRSKIKWAALLSDKLKQVMVIEPKSYGEGEQREG